MCKVCRLWGVLSRALFSYACRPNFHHKHLAPSDPVLSVCGEALISPHTCAKSWHRGLQKNAHFSGACVTEYECSCICVHARMCEAIQFYPPRSSCPASPLASLFSDQPFAFLPRLRFPAGRHRSLQTDHWRGSQSGQRLPFLSPLCLSLLRSSVLGQMRQRKPNNHPELWDKYLRLFRLLHILEPDRAGGNGHSNTNKVKGDLSWKSFSFLA